jgi:arylsulfatase A-like enzyme
MLRGAVAVVAGLAMLGGVACTPSGSVPLAMSSAAAAGRATPPNIVVLLADDLGIGEVGAWGQRDVATPHIDQLAREGLRFTEFRSSAAVCGPARCSFMTGYHNGRCRLDDNDNDYLRTTDVTLAERLRDAGYATALVGKWGLSWESEPESWPQAQGFDVFFGYRDQVHAHNFYPEYLLDGTDSLRTRNVVPAPRGMGSGYATVRRDYAPDLLRARAFQFVRERAAARTPLFLFWATNLPHIHNETSRTAPDGGYETPTLGPYASASWSLPKRSYAAQIHRLDEDLGALRTLLDSLGVAPHTMVVFLSDNGATFLRGPHDGSSEVIGRWFNGTLGYRGFKGDLYDGGLRVPGIVHWPGVVKPGRTTAARVDFTDLHATLVEVAGQRAPTTITGRSFLPLLTGRGSYAPREAQVWYSPDRRQSAVLAGKWKAVWMQDTMRVFNIEQDPGEQVDVSGREPQVVARLDSIRRAEDRRVTHPLRSAVPRR